MGKLSKVFLMYALFGSIFSVGKVALTASPPYFLTGIRMLLAAVIILGYLWMKQPEQLRLKKTQWRLIFWIAVFNVFITNAFEFWGLQYMTSGKTCLIYSLSPFAAALIGYFSRTEWMTPRKWLGLAIGCLSLAPMMLSPLLADEKIVEFSFLELIAEGALVISAITAVIGWRLVKRATTEELLAPATINGYSFLMAAAMSLGVSAITETSHSLPINDWSVFGWTVLYIALIHNIICYSIYANSLKSFSVTFMAFAGLSNPLFAGIIGWVFLDEPLTLFYWMALIGVSVGLFLYHGEEVSAKTRLGEAS